METFLHSHPIFSALLNLTILTSETKISNLTNSFVMHYSQPKMNQKSPKDPKSILILTMKLLYTYFWKTLPIGALISLTPIGLIWAQIAQPTSNHLKIERVNTKKSFCTRCAKWVGGIVSFGVMVVQIPKPVPTLKSAWVGTRENTPNQGHYGSSRSRGQFQSLPLKFSIYTPFRRILCVWWHVGFFSRKGCFHHRIRSSWRSEDVLGPQVLRGSLHAAQLFLRNTRGFPCIFSVCRAPKPWAAQRHHEAQICFEKHFLVCCLTFRIWGVDEGSGRESQTRKEKGDRDAGRGLQRRRCCHRSGTRSLWMSSRV